MTINNLIKIYNLSKKASEKLEKYSKDNTGYVFFNKGFDEKNFIDDYKVNPQMVKIQFNEVERPNYLKAYLVTKNHKNAKTLILNNLRRYAKEHNTNVENLDTNTVLNIMKNVKTNFKDAEFITF